MDNKKFLNKKSTVLGIFIICLLLIAFSIWAVASKHAKVVWKKPAERVLIVNPEVCDDSVVTSFNKATRYTLAAGATEETLDEAGLKSLLSAVKQKAGYQADPTCQTMLFIAAIHFRDYQGAKSAYDVIKQLHGKHLYVNSNVNTGGPLSTYDSQLNDLAPKQDNSEEKAEGGA